MRAPDRRLTDRRFTVRLSALLLVAVAWGCERKGGCTGEFCGTVVFAAPGKVDILLPPVSSQALARDVYTQVLLKLADIGPSVNTLGDGDFQPQLAARWEWETPTTLLFHLDPRARWHDGAPVTAADVAFTFAAYTDSLVNAESRPLLARIASVTARDSLTAAFTFRERYPEMFYDAVYHMYVLPRHLLDTVPRGRWATAAYGLAPVGDGPYRFVSWTPGQTLELAADSTFFLGRPHIRRLIWQFAGDQPAAFTQLLAGQADALEFLGGPDNVHKAQQTPQLTTYPYKSSAYIYMLFNLEAPGHPGRPHPVFGDRGVRRAVAMALDRARMCRSVFGELAKVPPGPMPQFWSVWDTTIRQLPYDTARAAAQLRRGGRRLSFNLIAPTTSAARRQYARLIQEQLRGVGVEVKIVEVEDNVMQERVHRGDFDAALLGTQADPSPTSSVTQHWGAGATGNLGHYVNPAFQRALEAAARSAGGADEAARAWHDAFGILNDDAPGVWLYSPDLVAGVHRRLADVSIRPDSWWALVRTWRIPADRLIDRDRVER